jgi:oligopeptide transport system substrate-binding protein
LRRYCFFVMTVGVCGKGGGGEDPNEMVLYSALGAKVRALDPGDIGDTTSSAVGSQFFECLYQYHYLKRPYELIPQLADGMPEISEDGRVYRIRINRGVRFHDDPCFEGGVGRELVAGDFVYAWKRIANLKNASKNWWIFDGRIVGLDEFREYTGRADEVDYARAVEGLYAEDDYTLVIKLGRPWPQILYLLAHLPTAPMAKEAVDFYGKRIINHPVGTGPYRLKLWHRGSYMEMVRNESWRDEYFPCDGEEGDESAGYLRHCGEKLPFADRVMFVLVQEDQPRWFLFLQGKIDASGIPKDNFSQAIERGRHLSEDMAEKGISLKIFRDPSTYWMGFNMEDPVLGGNPALRRAISYAVDRQKYIELFTNNRGERAFGFVPPLMKSYNPDVNDFGISFDPDKARELVKEARAIHGGPLPALELSLPSADAHGRQMGQFIRKMFRDVGLELNIEYMDWPTFQDKVKRRQAQMFMLGWIADYPDAENFLQLFYSKNMSPGPNNFNYSNDKFDAIYERIKTMQDIDQRTELYRKAEKIVVEDCPAVFLLHGVAYVLVHDWVDNYKPHAFGYGLSKYRFIDVDERIEYKAKYN